MKIKYLIAASVAALMVSGTAAKAADIVHYQEPEFKPAFSWTGLYAGGTVGYAKGKAKFKNKTAQTKTKVKPDGILGGFYAGYNFQFTDAILVGVDTDFLFSDVSKKKKSTGQSAREMWNGATRLRAGYAFNRFLPYAAVGISYADLKSKAEEKTKKKVRTGWNAGLGVDYAMTDHIVLRGEYRYTDLGKKKSKYSGDSKTEVKYNQNEFRVGVAYKF